MMTRLLFLLTITMISFTSAGNVPAAYFLTGAQLYNASSDGSIVAPLSNYRYTTHETDNGGRLSLTLFEGNVPNTQDRAISFSLLTQSATFEFNGLEYSDAVVSNIGLNLFFTDLDGSAPPNSYNPTNPVARQFVPGDLTIFNAIGASSSSFAFVSPGLSIMNYLYQGAGVTNATANGQKSFQVGGQFVTVTDFSVSLVQQSPGTFFRPTGSFTLTVTATPEPSTIGVGALAFCGLAGWVRKRRGKKQLADRK